jgi:hypothetical protein
VGRLIDCGYHLRMALHSGCAMEAQALLTFVKNDHLGCCRLKYRLILILGSSSGLCEAFPILRRLSLWPYTYQ